MTVSLIRHIQLIYFCFSIICARHFTEWFFVFTSNGHVFLFRACVIILIAFRLATNDRFTVPFVEHRYARAAILGEHDFGVTHMKTIILAAGIGARHSIDEWVLGIGYLRHDMEHIAPQPP